jgi:hypothetical protein
MILDMPFCYISADFFKIRLISNFISKTYVDPKPAAHYYLSL